MTIRSVGYDGSIGERDWSTYLAPLVGTPETVARPGDFRVTATTGMSVQVAPGTAHGWGVTDVSDAAENLQLEAPTSGSRFDAVVLRRDWSGTSATPTGAPTGGRTSIGYVKGGSVQTVPALARNGGQLTEQPLALVRVTAGVSTVQVVDDLRATHAKAAYARSLLAMTGPVGTRYVLEPDGRRYVMMPDASGIPTPRAEWEPPVEPLPEIPIVKAGTQQVLFDATGVGHITHNLGRRPKVVLFAGRTTNSSLLVDLTLTTQPGGINEVFFAVNSKVPIQEAPGWKPYTGYISYVDWIAVG